MARPFASGGVRGHPRRHLTDRWRPEATQPSLLTIAGSDSGGGAGIQADLKTFAAHGAYGMSVITAITAQNTREVTAVEEVSPEVVAAQIDAVMTDIGADAIKIGMLSSAAIVRAVANRLARYEPRMVVLDPVMVAKSGDSLLADEAVEALKEDLLPLATLVTPNLPEAERLTGLATAGATEAELLEAARTLAAAGPAVLIKGGHAEGSEVRDLLLDARGSKSYTHRRIESSSTHGTGCTLSSAIAARLAAGDELRTAVGGAIDYLHGAIAAAFPLGSGHGPVNHFHRVRA